MQDLPHHYCVTAAATTAGDVTLGSEGVADIVSAPPREFGGPGDKWSPESLLVAAVADCFVLTFRAIARASKISWQSLSCEVTGTLERSDGVTRFTRFAVRATVHVPADANEERAVRCLQKAEAGCLITNSLSGTTHLEASVVRA